MNEIKLSDNLQQIELEIQHHKNVAGQSIWEIGRRLNHVKENDLAHGQFIDWVENNLEIGRTQASKFMRIANEFPNVQSTEQLGVEALYLIATLPEEDREKEHELDSGETKTVDEMTTRELREVKKKNKQQEETIKEQERKLKQKAEPEWTSGLGWLSEQTGIKSPQQLKERLLYPFRDELENFVDYPENQGETWRFNSYHLKFWLRNNFERVAK